MLAEESSLQSVHKMIRIQQNVFIFCSFSTKSKHGNMFVVAFKVFGSVSGGTAVLFF